MACSRIAGHGKCPV
jgi:hypothetical protein